MLADITCRAFIKCSLGNLNSQAVKYSTCKHDQVSRYEHQGISRKLASRVPFSKNLMSSQKVQVTLPLSFYHALKRPKVIESDMLLRTLVVVYLFCALEIRTNDSL